VKLRERLHFTADKRQAFWESVRKEGWVSECVILSTCNRVEIYFVAEDMVSASMSVRRAIAACQELSVEVVNFLVSEHAEDAALERLFSVTSGIESMVFGETEILGQIKAAYHACFEEKMTSAILNKVFQMAIAVGKRAREETAISQGSASVSSIAIDAMKEHYGDDFYNRNILIIGAGTMATRAIKKLQGLGHRNLYLTNRGAERMASVAADLEITPVAYGAALSNLDRYDALIAATSSHTVILSPTHLGALTEPMFIIDLGVPRNVDNRVGSFTPVTLVTIDDLTEIANRNVENRKRELHAIRDIISSEIFDFWQWYSYKLQHAAVA
jgi:glutamyl-tRNA reductase